MAIYGHMNKKQLPQDDQDPPPEKTDEIPSMEETEVDETIMSFMQEAEDVMKRTQEGATQETNRIDLEETTKETDQHFTIVNSPTRFQHHKDTKE